MFGKNGHYLQRIRILGIAIIVSGGLTSRCWGEEPTQTDRYGPLGLLDHRSIYGQYWFPEPLRADESDVDNEIRADYFHAENHSRQFDSMRAEIEKSFGLMTIEISPGYESDRTSSIDPITGEKTRDTEEGFTNIEIGARVPFYQYVSPGGRFDSTFVFGMEVAPPVLSKISKDVEIVPKLFNLTRLGDHFSVQLGLGNSVLIGPQDHGLSTLEYDAVFGYELAKQQLPLPFVLSTVSILEFDGEYTLNQESAGQNQLFGTAGFRFNFDSISWLPAQPRIGIGYTFPIDQGARDEFRWGIVTSLVFEY